MKIKSFLFIVTIIVMMTIGCSEEKIEESKLMLYNWY